MTNELLILLIAFKHQMELIKHIHYRHRTKNTVLPKTNSNQAEPMTIFNFDSSKVELFLTKFQKNENVWYRT